MKRLVQLGCIGVLASATVLGGRAQELNPGLPTLPAGLVRAFGEIGQKILGASNFFSTNPGPPEARSLEVWLNDTSNVAVRVNIFDTNPGPPNTWLRMTIVNGAVVLQQDRTIGNPDIVPEYGTDPSAFLPPNPIVEISRAHRMFRRDSRARWARSGRAFSVHQSFSASSCRPVRPTRRRSICGWMTRPMFRLPSTYS